ncbi:hypothetical protein [Streptomyces sp. B5E4]|uniref:hypothetical protein n=1 Tax=Streptomyces sp. B5E4 TaxID=3153568 RepID=UPI00325D4447
MTPDSPAEALGRHAANVRDVIVEVVRSLHDRFAEAHQISGSRYTMGFGGQWRDLLEDAHDALTRRGFVSHKLSPGGYKIPVVNDCLLYVWRIPDTADAVSQFASSPTRKNGFSAPPPDPTLFDPGFMHETEPGDNAPDDGGLGRELMAVSDTMPVVLVTVQSSPRQLRSIQWGIAVYDEGTGTVHMRGQEVIWESEPIIETETSDVESFDTGEPAGPTVELREQEGPRSDA